ncbi:MAG: Smr/MutS family protein [Magnetospirillum sp.]|nr:Smr/MutS family protein [Magnetospirillum sp.]
MSANRTRRRVLSPDEARIWRAIASSATPLPGHELPELEPEPEDVTLPEPVASPPPPILVQKAPPPVRRELHGLAHGTTAGVDKRSAERMKKGEMEIDGRLDLHGMTQDSAHGHLVAFINRAYDAGKRCVLVITGKGNREGTGVLRANTPRWLNQSPCRERILAFSFAKPQHGGEGALYVMIKRRR